MASPANIRSTEYRRNIDNGDFGINCVLPDGRRPNPPSKIQQKGSKIKS
jgi:hypothetical protein